MAARKQFGVPLRHGPYLKLSDDEKYDHAQAIAQYVWTLPERPAGVYKILVKIAWERDGIVDLSKTDTYFFYPKQLNVAR